jgi:hypothetical protein
MDHPGRPAAESREGSGRERRRSRSRRTRNLLDSACDAQGGRPLRSSLPRRVSMVDYPHRRIQSSGDERDNRRVGDLERLCLCVGHSAGSGPSPRCCQGVHTPNKNRRSASEFVSAIETIIIDARFEWYEIFDGKYEAGEIMDRWRKLARLMNETEGKYFPDGLPMNAERQRLAEAEASAYFSSTYGVGGIENG